MLEREQYEPWMDASIGYWGHPLAAYDSLKIWTVDPKHQPYANVIKNSLWPSFDGSLGAASAGCLADFIVVNMFASVCAGQRTPKEAMAEAAKRAKRYYDV
jgi:multiple sugar transport system substrate-binding protein